MHFDPFDYQNLFYEYEIKITEEEIKQINILVKNNRDNQEQQTTFFSLNILNLPLLKKIKKTNNRYFR